MHLELNWSLIFTSHLNFRFSEHQWLFTIRAKNIPSLVVVFMSPCFSFLLQAHWTMEQQIKLKYNPGQADYFSELLLQHQSPLCFNDTHRWKKLKLRPNLSSLAVVDSVREAGGCCCVFHSARVAASTGDWLSYYSQAAWASTSLPKMVLFHSERAREQGALSNMILHNSTNVMPFVLLQ